MRCPFAGWRGPIPNVSAGTSRPARGLVLHVIVGTLTSADQAFHNPAWKASAHFGISKSGDLVQWVDTKDKAWAQAAGNAEWYSVETEGQPDEPLTAAQVDTCALLLFWLHQQDGFPLQVTDDIHGKGLTSHRCGGKAWGGHPCPGDQRHAQRAEIVAKALRLQNPIPDPKATVMALAAPIHSIHPHPSGHGYWLLGEDFGVFAFGNATYFGHPNDGTDSHGKTSGKPAGLVPSNTGAGYLIASTEGTVFAYGDAEFHGSAV